MRENWATEGVLVNVCQADLTQTGRRQGSKSCGYLEGVSLLGLEEAADAQDSGRDCAMVYSRNSKTLGLKGE